MHMKRVRGMKKEPVMMKKQGVTKKVSWKDCDCHLHLLSMYLLMKDSVSLQHLT